MEIIEYFLDSGFLVRSDGEKGCKITRQGFDKLPIWASLSKTFIESYWITAKAMAQEKSRSISTENLLKKISYLGKRYHRLGVIEHAGSLSRINYKNAIALINRKIMNATANPGNRDHQAFESLSHLSKRLYDFSQYGQ